jgi:ParB/RepB/Spo0J family partition protein
METTPQSPLAPQPDSSAETVSSTSKPRKNKTSAAAADPGPASATIPAPFLDAALAATERVTEWPADFRLIPTAQIVPSKTNPRKNFDGPEMDELVESVRQHRQFGGVLVPVLVRPRPHVYTQGDGPSCVFDDARPGSEERVFELVAGERRWRAAQAVGLEVIPAMVRELTDEEALEIQLIENLQRKDISALEEAAGYVQLVDAMNAVQHNQPGRHLTRQEIIEQIAQKIGKSARYVYARMKLDTLIPEVKQALAAGRIEPSHADLLVRLDGKRQLKFLREDVFEYTAEDAHPGEDKTLPHGPAVSVRDLVQRIEYDSPGLNKAPWKLDDARAKGLPVCSSCESNTATQEGSDPKKPRCLNSACFEQKRSQLVELDLTHLEAKTGKNRIRIQKSEYGAPKGVLPKRDWAAAKLGSCDNVAPGVEIECHFREGAKKGAEISVRAVCTNKKCKTHFPAASKDASVSKEAAAKRLHAAARKQATGRECTVRYELAANFIATVTKLTPEILRAVLRDLACHRWARLHEEARKLAGVEIEDVLANGKTDSPEFAKTMAACLLTNGMIVNEWLGPEAGRKEFHEELASLGFDPVSERRKIEARLNAAKTAAKIEKGKCRYCGCTQAHACVLELPKGAKAAVTCKWADAGKTVCSNRECMKKAKADPAVMPDKKVAAAKKPPAEPLKQAKPANKKTKKAGRK